MRAMDRPESRAVALVIVLGIIIMVALVVMVYRGISGYAKALQRFENPEADWPQGKWQPPRKRYQDVPPELPPLGPPAPVRPEHAPSAPPAPAPSR
jgi:hypothetical protein